MMEVRIVFPVAEKHAGDEPGGAISRKVYAIDSPECRAIDQKAPPANFQQKETSQRAQTPLYCGSTAVPPARRTAARCRKRPDLPTAPSLCAHGRELSRQQGPTRQAD